MLKPTKEVFLAKKIDRISRLVLIAVVLLGGLHPVFASGEGASIRGIITNQEGEFQPGAYLYLSSPSLLGILNFIATQKGRYTFFDLPPGIYQLKVEKPGFKTVTVEDIRLSPDGTALVDVRLEPTEIEEEPASRRLESGLDKVSAATVSIIDADLISRIPMPRSFPRILGLFSAVTFDGGEPDGFASIHGGPSGGNIMAADGINVTDPITGGLMSKINPDLIEMVVVESAGHSADRGTAEGGFVNVLFKSGGDSFSGGLSLLHSNKYLAKTLYSMEELDEMGVLAPVFDQHHWDFSLSMGGAAIKDLAWFFTNFRILRQQRTTPFVPWADPNSVVHWDFPWSNTDFSGLLKLSTRVTPQASGFLEFGLGRISQPVFEEEISRKTPKAATRSLDGEKFILFRAGMTYALNQETLVNLSAGFSSSKDPFLLNNLGAGLPQYIDLASGYTWGSGSYNELAKNNRLAGSLVLTRFQERVLGADHEFKLGAEYEMMAASSSSWKWNNLIMYYSMRDPYTYGEAVSPESGETVGLGLIGFSVVPRDRGAMASKQDLRRIGLFAQDTLTFAGRVALSVGLRYDRSASRIAALVKGASGNTISIEAAEELIKPEYGVNPFLQTQIPSVDNIITWNTLSPRVGLSVDLLGTGRTVARASFARYPEYLRLGYTRLLLPIPPERVHRFFWYDENEDGYVDGNDTITLFQEDYRIYQEEFYNARVDSKLKSPTTEEWTAGIEQEIRKGFTLSLRYIYKSQENVVGSVLYDPDTDAPWYSSDGAAADWWLPFQTIVPATNEYPETAVTVYFPSAEAPALFERIQNVSELSRKYRAFEISLRRNWDGNWQFAGSVAFGRSTGTAGLAPGLSSGISGAVLSPNSFVNVPATSLLDLDRPVRVRLMGTARLPWDFVLSLFFQASSGAPWSRSVTVIPPESWTQETGAAAIPASVHLESPGTHREKAWTNLDLGIDKEFKYKARTFLTLSVNVLNVLGGKYRFLDLNDGGLWYPSEENSSAGERVISETYNKSLSVWGTRTVYIKLKLGF